jgi:hypothetical protein
MAITTNVETSMPPPHGMRVPAHPEELDPPWLTACLRHAGVLGDGERVVTCELTRVGEGGGFAGRIFRVALRYEPASTHPPASLIAKFASAHAPTRDLMSMFDAYAREVRFYRELAGEVGLGTPRCYFAHYDKAEGLFLVLLEDLAPAETAPREQGYTLEQAQLVLEQLAAMHARFWNRVDHLPWLVLSDELFTAMRERFLAAVPRVVSRFGRDYPTLARAARQFEVFFEGDEVTAETRRPPLTVAHNDMHIDNVFLPSAHGGRFAVIDWQSVAVSRQGTSDVARVLCMSLQPETRRRHASTLLRHYHRALRAHGVRDYSLRALHYRYRQELVTAVVISILAFDTLDFAEHEDGTPRLIASRVDAALADGHVVPMLVVLGAWLRFRRWLRRLFARA